MQTKVKLTAKISHTVKIPSAFDYQTLTVPVLKVESDIKTDILDDMPEYLIPENSALYILGEDDLDLDPVGYVVINGNQENLIDVTRLSRILINAVSSGDTACTVALQVLTTAVLTKSADIYGKRKNRKQQPSLTFHIFSDSDYDVLAA